MKLTLAAAAIVSAVSAWENSIPVYGYFPGWVNGQGLAGIHINMIEDWLCSDCAAENPVLNELMTTPWLNGVVGDYITMSFTPFPLPYHIFAFQVAQITPYLMDLCISDPTKCLMNEYKDYCFENQNSVLSQVNMSLDDFIPWWTSQVATALNLD